MRILQKRRFEDGRRGHQALGLLEDRIFGQGAPGNLRGSRLSARFAGSGAWLGSGGVLLAIGDEAS